MSSSNRPWGPAAPTMDKKKVVLWISAGVVFTLFYIMLMVVGGIPPWPLLIWFALSHGFFCWFILRVKPYRGPYTHPIENEVPPDQPEN